MGKTARRGIIAALVSFALVAPAAWAAEPSGTDDQAKQAKRICKSVEITGSRMRERICQSKAEWDRDTEQAFRLVRDGQEQGYRKDGEFSGQDQVQAPR